MYTEAGRVEEAVVSKVAKKKTGGKGKPRKQ